MNDLSIIVSSVGKIGTLERITPEYLEAKVGEAKIGFTGAIGMVHTNRISFDGDQIEDGDRQILSTIIVNTTKKKTYEITEFHGVLFFKPMENMKPREQMNGFKSHPSMFEGVHPLKLESNKDYIFYSRRVSKSAGETRNKL